MVDKLSSTEKQIEILNKLARIMIISAADCDSRTCIFEVDIENESVGQEFYFVKNGKKFSALLDDPDWVVMDLVFDLHKEMKSHTGGDWTEFTLTIGEDGKAKTTFKYRE
jgi:hypothetical protein